MADGTKPVDDDIRYDDEEYNPALKPGKSHAWLNLLEESEAAFERWHEHCDNIDKLFASLERLERDRAAARVSDVLVELRGAQAGDLRPAAGAGGGAEIQGPPADLSGRRPRCWSAARWWRST